MGINFRSILGTLGKAVDFGAKAGIPVATQIDAVTDAIKDIKGKRKIDEENVYFILENLQELKASIPTSKSALSSNRFKATLIGIVTALAAHYGLPSEIATQIAEVVFYFVATYVVADTLRSSNK